jgi:hypothetical protein
MKKLSLNILAFYIGILAAFSQSAPADSSYQPKKLTLTEVNLVSGYYTQDGNHSAVTGGVGTEKLTDISNTIELKLIKFDSRSRERSVNFELGIDHYTSASSDKINPATISSASYADTRIYPSLSYTIKDAEKGTTIGAVASFSSEYDYISKGLGINFAKASKDNNREFSIKAQAYLDQWKIILPVELRSLRESEGYTPRNSYSTSLAYSQVVNQRFQFVLMADAVMQKGLLGTSYQRVYFKDNSENYEHLPDNRFKLPVGIKANYFLSDRFVFRSSYRFYTDNWGVRAHTADLEIPIKLNPFFSISPFYRYYTQSAANYFAPYGAHSASETYFTSDYDLSKFNSQFFGAGFRVTPEKGLLGIKKLNMIEMRYGRYARNNNLNANIISMNLRFK